MSGLGAGRGKVMVMGDKNCVELLRTVKSTVGSREIEV